MVYYAMARKKKKKVSFAFFTLIGAIGHIFKSPIVLSWVLAIVGLITLTAMSVPKLRATQYPASDFTVSFSAPPIWLNGVLLQELQDVAKLQLSKTEVSRESLIRTADALASTGWFLDVSQVRWVDENEAVIDATFLIPYARVQDGLGSVYVDDRGRRLPNRNGEIVNPRYHFISITSPEFDRPQRPGLQWNGADVAAGLEVLKLLYNKPWATQVHEISLLKWNTSKTIRLVSDSASTFIWGSAPGNERPLESLATKKLEWLNSMFESSGRIDLGSTAEFDLTNPTRVYRN
jgi:hypothetical protein